MTAAVLRIVFTTAFSLAIFGLLARWWKGLTVGTKSVLVGAHAFWLHPFFVALAWWKLYGFRSVICPSSDVRTRLLDWRLWIAFVVHDLGYVGCPNMDGPEGEQHPVFGAGLLDRVAKEPLGEDILWPLHEASPGLGSTHLSGHGRWYLFALCHSRFFAKRFNLSPSLLCFADKLVPTVEPWWLYIPRAILSGEIVEYMRLTQAGGKYSGEVAVPKTRRQWYADMADFSRRWAEAHKDGRSDTWTAAEVAR